MKRNLLSLLLFICFGSASALRLPSSAASLEMGSTWDNGANVDIRGTWYWPLDQMVFFGTRVGLQQRGDLQRFPFGAVANIRLPIGRIILPTVKGEFGGIADGDLEMYWRGALGFDLKLGDHSSLVADAGIEGFDFRAKHLNASLLGGILIEW